MVEGTLVNPSAKRPDENRRRSPRTRTNAEGCFMSANSFSGVSRFLCRSLSVAGSCAFLAWSGGGAPPFLTRGPFLQSASPTGITLVCRTNTATAVTLRFGEQAGPPWEGEITSPLDTTHVFELDALRPETSYLYELAAGDRTLAAGEEYAFCTAPPAESRAPFRFLAWGDSGTGTLPQFDVAERIESA